MVEDGRAKVETGANITTFFDEFNKGDTAKTALTEEVNRKLCEVLTELAEDIVDGLAEAGAQELQQKQAQEQAQAQEGQQEQQQQQPANGGPDGAEGAAHANGSAQEDGEPEAVNGVDEVAALAAYNDAMAAILREKDLTSKDMCGLPDDHPLKELFFSAFDSAMFHELLARFIGQVRGRKEGPGEWDAEAAEGECDEDHTLE